MARGIYLDNSSTTCPSHQVVSKMMPYLTDLWGMPSAPHVMGQEVIPAIYESLKHVYALLGAKETDDVIMTSSGAEAVNQAILAAYFDVTLSTGKNHFITSQTEEAPPIMSIGRLEKLNCVGKMVHPGKNGQVTAKILADAITPRTAMISLSWGNGLTGVIQPVNDIAALCKERGILLHLDATHVLGKLYFDLDEVGAPLISFNGDHIHAPKGTGGLYIRAGTRCSPLIVGGIEQGGHRAGSFNVPGVVGLGEAAREALDSRDLLCTEVARLRDKLEIGIVAGFPEAVPFYRDQERLPHCTAVAFPGIVNEAFLFQLNRKGVFASIGGGSFQQLTLILQGAGVSESLAQTAVSFSLSRETTEDEIDRAIEIIVDTARRMRRLSEKIKWDF